MSSRSVGRISGQPRKEASPLQRRGVLASAGGLGAAAIAARLLPGTAPSAVTAPAAAAAKVVDTDGGYRLTPHVARYYETTRS